MPERTIDAMSYVPDWMKAVFFGFLSLFQLGAGIAYAETPKQMQSGGFKVDAITVVALASPFVTLAIGAMTIVSRHRITERQMDSDRDHDRLRQDIDARQKAIEVRLSLLERGIPCEHDDCPVVEVATGKRPWDRLPPMRKPDEPTVDMQ